jgi:saccharopine dehydrogenase-like NADP-dependent oxidoreductase
MKVFCLGGAGRICRESALDVVRFADFERLTIGDVDGRAGREVVDWLGDDRVDFVPVDLRNHDATVAQMRGYDVVMDGTTISLNDRSTACIAAAGCHGINLNGFGEEYKYNEQFAANGKVHVPGFGMTPGTTNMMAVHAAEQLDQVFAVRVSHGAFRPIAFSASITETTTYEYDPDLPGRLVYENGEFIQVPPFARPREIKLPEPYGTHPQYIIPHSETKTLADYLHDRGVKLIEVRGTWPPPNMQLIRALYDWGILRNPRIEVNGNKIGVLDAIAQYLIHADIGRNTALYGYALHVEVTGLKDNLAFRHTITHTHPPSDGSVADWAGLRAYTRCVGIPMSIGAQLLAANQVGGKGVLIPERAFRPTALFEALKLRDIHIHHEIEEIDESQLME